MIIKRKASTPAFFQLLLMDVKCGHLINFTENSSNTAKETRQSSRIIREKTKVADILIQINLLEWRWTSHLIQDKQNKWSTSMSNWYPRDGKSSRGCQQVRWEEAYVRRHTVLRDCNS